MVFAIPHLALLTGGLVSFAICMAIVLTKGFHGDHTLDSQVGVQKIHQKPTPRIGGVAIYAGLIVTYFLTPTLVAVHLKAMLFAAFPAFVAGVIEDIIKRGGVTERLLATFASGLLGWWLTGVSITRVGIPGIDMLLAITPVSVIFTVFAVGGVANAINIIDGLNGLAGGTVLLCLSALGIIAFQAGDVEMAKLCLVLTAAIFGFFAMNYPLGKIFLGDGGAYLLGFLTAWAAVMIAMRNPSISPWAPLLACGYPIIEVLFSMARRRARDLELGQPDRLHLHSLVWSRIARKVMNRSSKTKQNAIVLPIMLFFALIPAVLSIKFKDSTPKLIFAFLVCSYLYALIYARLIHFKWVRPKLRLLKKTNNRFS